MKNESDMKVDVSGMELSGKRVHFVGIGGCGMSGLARIVRAFGGECTGSDITESSVTESLVGEGIDVVLGQSAETVPVDCDILVTTAAVDEEHCEVVEAKRRGVKVIKYAKLLGELMAGRVGVAIAGTHGKSTTTAMLAHLLIRAGLDPTFIVGAICEQIGGGVRVGGSEIVVAEACEYDRSFHNFKQRHSVVLNVEEDHLDIYGSLEGVIEGFNKFAKQTPVDGSLLIGHDSACRRQVVAGVECEVETIGFSPDADWVIRTDKDEPNGVAGQEVEILHRGERVCRFSCQMAGEHMAYNASVAVVTAWRLGGRWDELGKAMSEFEGLGRRMQLLGEVDGVRVIDDYGHHPTEIDATLRALRTYYKPEDGGRLICVFQPHQHSRTRFLLAEFASSFSHADIVVVPHIYFVRDSEADCRAVSAADLVYELQKRGIVAMHIDDFGDIVTFLRNQCRDGDLLVVMGAGPVWKIGREFVGGEK